MFEYIKNNFMGAFIVVILRSGAILSGEVVEGGNSLIALKSNGITVHINPSSIEAFF